jgi:hypothetical protein
MTIPAPVCTVTPNTVTQTYANLAPSVMLADTTTPTPAATGRTWEADTVAVKSTVGATGAGIQNNVPYPVNLANGARNIRVKTTNTDGTGTSGNVTLTVTDSVVAANTLITDSNNLTVRMHPDKLSYEYRDPTMTTPGPQTASGIYNARTRGSI